MRTIISGILLAVAAICPTKAFAVTECAGRIASVFAGDGGTFYIFLDNGAATHIQASNPNAQNTIAIALTALATSRPVKIRFAADNVSCTTGRSDFEGIWLM